jgi:hypothetical protein
MRFRVVLLALCLTAVACQTQRTVLIQADGQSRLVTVYHAETVSDALTEAGVTVGERDRVTPDLYARLPRSGSITIVRVTERIETETEAIPFQREVLRDESLPKGETHLLHLGTPGQLQRTYRVTLEDGIPIRREFVEERVLQEPVNETLRVGTMGSLPSVPVTGTLVYLSGGNAWVIRSSTANKRPVTFSGDLDGRVFALAPDGQNLAFTRRPGQDGSALNTLWLLNTLVLGETPVDLQQPDVLAADWSGESLVVTTGQATPGPPGWKANNDLWLVPGPGYSRQALPSLGPAGTYGWWGRDLAMSPNGRLLAYAAPDSVGLLDLLTGERRVLVTFTPVRTLSDWVWTPGLAWSPDGRTLAAVIHGPPVAGEAPEDSPLFDLWILPVESSTGTLLVPNVGMWALPAWSPTGNHLAYGVAQEPRSSQKSLYDLWVLSVTDNQRTKLLQETGWGGIQPQRVAWSPQGDQLVVSNLGDLYLVDLHGSRPQALTDDGRSSLPQWR